MLTALRRARRSLPLGLRTDAAELLDGGRLTMPEVERNLADLARLNRLPGGIGASVDGVRRLVDGRRDARILDAGTGRGDMPIAFARRGWATTALDRNPDVLLVARRETSAHSRIEVVEGDARSLPFEDDAFDVSHCSLVVHHLDPTEAVTALRELGRVARRGVVINDLRRGILPLVATAISVVALGGSRVTRADGLVSARRAYTLDELDDLIGEAGLTVRWRSPGWLPRVVTAATPAA
ncbi:MAG TPA: methyltransferase domain-containing protein [Candidatus Limnocylindrales bacterium]|nr:methyltransferase domain-containing protein [Candidatus Limnocylindrales bacterium]